VPLPGETDGGRPHRSRPGTRARQRFSRTRSYSWLDQRVRNGELLRSDGTAIEPLRSQGGYRYFTFEMLEDIVKYCYRQRGYTFKELKSVIRELVIAAHGDTGEDEIPERGVPRTVAQPSRSRSAASQSPG
jgi:hypothetical protein